MFKTLWRKKPITHRPDGIIEDDGQGLKRLLGPVQLIALGVGGTIGAGLFSVTGIAAGQNSGAAVTLSFIIAALTCSFAGLCYAELAGMLASGGSAYTYAYAAMGELMAWIIGWDLILEYTVNAATVASSWSGYFTSLLEGCGLYPDPRLLAPSFTPVTMPDGHQAMAWFNLPGLLILFGVTAMLMHGMSKSSKINTAIAFIKLLVIAGVSIACIPHIRSSNLHPFIPPNTGTFGHFGWSGVIQAAGVIFFAYVGFDIVSTAAQDAHNPQKNIPAGVLGTLIICAVIYVFFSFVLVGVINYKDMANSANPVALAIDAVNIPWLAGVVKLGITIGYISVIYGLLMGQSRIAMAMADDGLIPRFFARLHSVRRTPWGSHMLTAVLGGILAGMVPIGILGKMTSIGTLLAFILVCTGVMILRYKAPDLPRRFRVPGGPWLVPCLGILSCSSVMLAMDGMTWLRLAAWLLVGGGIYLCYGFRHSILHKNIASPPKHETHQ